jgi:predicted phage terminase large subunit-like protein
MEKPMKINKQEFRVVLRNYFVAFVERSFLELNPQTEFQPNWHIDVIAEALEQCRAGKLRRLIINVPPRSLKSHMTSISFVAWLMGHNPSAQIICASYAQDLADKLAADSRSLMTTEWYQDLFPSTRLATGRSAVHDFTTTERGSRMATSVGGAFTGRGADFIIIDDPLKPDEALSETQRNTVNDWFDHTLVSRLNDQRTGCIILIMQRLHEDDLVGHVLAQGGWRLLKFPAIAEEDESHTIQTPHGLDRVGRKIGEALHPARESREELDQRRCVHGEYNFAGQYQQAPAPLGGGMVKLSWFKKYTAGDLPNPFELCFQSWDTANKAGELNDYSVCTTWGLKDKKLYLLNVLRRRMEFPELRRAIRDHAAEWRAGSILIEDQASGTQLVQDLIHEGVQGITCYTPKMEKIMRMNSVTSIIENGFVFLPEKADWLAEYLHELTTFPNGKYDDQVDSTSQALDWIKARLSDLRYAWFRLLARRHMIEDGKLEEVREMDAIYGTPLEEPKPAVPSAAVVYTGSGEAQKSAGPCVYYGPEGEDPESRRLKRRSNFPWK